MDPASWSAWTYWLYGWALYCSGALVFFWFRFHGLEKKAMAGDEAAIKQFNAALVGFPNMVMAKMFGKRPLE